MFWHRVLNKGKRGHQIFVIVVLAALVSCTSENVLNEFADKTSDDSIYFAAVQALNSQNYSTAISLIGVTSASFQADREVKLVLASAHAGLCGFNFIDFVQALSATTTDTLFTVLFKTMLNGSVSTQDSCTTAIGLLQEISSEASARTDDENILMALVSMARMGIILNKNADGDQDGAVDGTFDYCSDISDADYRQIVVGVANTILSLNEVSSTVASDDIALINATCSDLEASGFTGVCSTTETGDVSSNQILGIKGFVGSNQSEGLGTCNDSVANCAAACP